MKGEERSFFTIGVSPDSYFLLVNGGLLTIDCFYQLFWIGNGPYDNYTSKKYVLECSPQELQAVAKLAGHSDAVCLSFTASVGHLN